MKHLNLLPWKITELSDKVYIFEYFESIMLNFRCILLIRQIRKNILTLVILLWPPFSFDFCDLRSHALGYTQFKSGCRLPDDDSLPGKSSIPADDVHVEKTEDLVRANQVVREMTTDCPFPKPADIEVKVSPINIYLPTCYVVVSRLHNTEV